MRQNNIRAQLAQGRAAIGCCLNINSPHLVELAGAIGFEWVFIDCEHGSMSETDVENMVRAAEAFGVTPVVRVPSNSASEILRFLDLGAMGIVVPHVDNEADAIRTDARRQVPAARAAGLQLRYRTKQQLGHRHGGCQGLLRGIQPGDHPLRPDRVGRRGEERRRYPGRGGRRRHVAGSGRPLPVNGHAREEHGRRCPWRRCRGDREGREAGGRHAHAPG
ncbi:MAG: hypothetical protein HQ548_00380 [Chloroflexi bacterium]|nr:hypothetical protein [Chloroflexota bacterium]